MFLCLSSSSNDHRPLPSCWGTGARVETLKQVLSLSCTFGSSGILDRIWLCWCFGGSSFTILPIATMESMAQVNTLQYHDTFDFVPDPETEDPQSTFVNSKVLRKIIDLLFCIYATCLHVLDHWSDVSLFRVTHLKVEPLLLALP